MPPQPDNPRTPATEKNGCAPGWWPIHGRDRPGPATRPMGQCRRSSFKTFLETEIAANVQRAAQGIQTFLASDRLLTKEIEGLVTQFGVRRLQTSAHLLVFGLGPYCPCLTHIGKLYDKTRLLQAISVPGFRVKA